MRKIFKDRHDYIKDYCSGKDVLHIGCVGTAYKDTNKYNPWLHKEITKFANSNTGVDWSISNIAHVKQYFPDTVIFEGDATDLNLNKKFDVIVAGEIIEHITDLNGFFRSIKRHMHENSVLILTTPNPFRLNNIIDCILRRNTRSQSSDHVMYFDVWTMKVLLERFNLELDTYYFNTEVAKQRIRNIILRTVGFFWPIFHMNLMVVAKLNEKEIELMNKKEAEPDRSECETEDVKQFRVKLRGKDD